LDGFDNFGYDRLADKYPVKLVDLDKEPFDILYVFDEKGFQTFMLYECPACLFDPDSYIVSVARMKTHDHLVVATLSLKNIIFGAPIKDLSLNK